MKIKNLSVLFCLFALICSLMAIATAQPPANATKPQPTPTPIAKPGSIKGRIITEDGQPVANIPVFASAIGREGARRMGGPTQTTTDDDGAFEFENLPPASYSVSASAPGYIAPMPDVERGAGIYHIGDMASITLVKGGVITGRVTNAVGDPLTGVSVAALRTGALEGESEDDGDAARSAAMAGFGRNWRTDDRGVYRIYGLAAGTYVVQAGGRNDFGPNPLSLFSGDAPTYYPSSPRDAAVAVPLRAGEELAGIDIRYRGEKGRIVSGKVIAKVGETSAGFNGVQITLAYAGSGAVVTTGFQMDRAPDRGANNGFALYGVPDGEYQITARRGGVGGESDAMSAPRRVSVRGADVSGIELSLTPLASISGRVVIERNVAACPSQRGSSIVEILLTARREDLPANAMVMDTSRPAVPATTGEFALRNLDPGRWRVEVALPGDHWYLRAMTVETKPPVAAARKTGTPTAAARAAIVDAARNGITLKTGEKSSGLTVTVAEGAASLKGKVIAGQDGIPAVKLRVHLIPAEKESAEDVLRYAHATTTSDGGFEFRHLAPGRYFLLARPHAKGEPAMMDAAGRATLRKAAETAADVIDLAPCQKVQQAVSLRLSRQEAR